MGAHIFRVDSITDAQKLISVLSQTDCDHRIPLVQATIDRRICHQEFQRSSPSRPVKLFLAAAGRKPSVVILGDDDDEPTGPDKWPCAKRLMAWAKLVIIHGTGGERCHYEAAVDAAQTFHRVLFVETNSALVPAWIVAAHAAPSRPVVQLHITQPGVTHPIPGADLPVMQ